MIRPWNGDQYEMFYYCVDNLIVFVSYLSYFCKFCKYFASSCGNRQQKLKTMKKILLATTVLLEIYG